MTDKATLRGNAPIREMRAYPCTIEVRAQGDGNATITGYASVTETPYDMYDMFGPYTEVVSHGAFAKTLGEEPKVQLLVNHGGLSLASTTAGTLRLSEDSTGLHMEAEVNTKRADARDAVLAVEDRAADEMSFAFRVVRQSWSPDYEERRIDEVNLNRGDVSIVNLGANPHTSVGMRAQDFSAFLDQLTGDALDEALARLQARKAAQRPGMSLALARLL